MAVYAIGDLQGCYDELQHLLERIEFDPGHDRLWFVGDLVNRGPQSLECLRFVHALGGAAVTVLGNHDLSLLASAAGLRRSGARDTLEDVLEAPDRDELLDWLRHRPLLYADPRLGYALVHAGLAPQWTLEQAMSLAEEVHAVLRGGDYRAFFAAMYGDRPDRWDEALTGMERLRFIVNALTRIRYCTPDGRLELHNKESPRAHEATLIPWFEFENRQSRGARIVFGHWSTLSVGERHNTWSVDSGCVWGGRLTALRLDRPRPVYTDVPCDEKQTPG